MFVDSKIKYSYDNCGITVKIPQKIENTYFNNN